MPIESFVVTLPAVLTADTAGWVTAAATSVAAVAAVIAGVFAFRAFGQQARQLAIIQGREQDRQEDRRSESEEKRKAQARLIAGWVTAIKPMKDEWSGSDMTPLFLVNSSREPVYNVVATLVLVQGAGGPRRGEDWADRHKEKHDTPMTTAAVLLPGHWRVLVRGTHWTGAMAFRAAAEVAFTDRAGAHWVRRGTGELEELPESPITYFERHGFYGPHDLVTPEPAP